MAKCVSCGTEIGLFNSYGPGGNLCGKCNRERVKKPESLSAEEKREHQAAIESVMLTTESHPSGLRIVERIEVVTAE